LSIEQIWDNFYMESTRADLDKCWESASGLSPLQNVLEVGVCGGGSLKYWSERVPVGGLVIGVDINLNIFNAITSRPGTWQIEEMRDMPTHVGSADVTLKVAKMVSDREVYVVCGDSARPSTRLVVESLAQGREFDFFFHDGIHYSNGPLLDFNNLQHLLRLGGVFCLADTSLSAAENDVFLPFHKITPDHLGTNQVYFRLPPEKWDLGCSQQTISWIKDRELEMS
jgi:SAM-dependent methyltransferase